MTQKLKYLTNTKEKLCVLDLHLRLKEESLGPELCKVLFPFWTSSELQEKKAYLLPLRNFFKAFFLSVLVCMDKETSFNIQEKKMPHHFLLCNLSKDCRSSSMKVNVQFHL